jgi:hypothetical protein
MFSLLTESQFLEMQVSYSIGFYDTESEQHFHRFFEFFIHFF